MRIDVVLTSLNASSVSLAQRRQWPAAHDVAEPPDQQPFADLHRAAEVAVLQDWMRGTIDSQFTVTTEDAFDETGANVILCKIADSMYEINVYLSSSDISKIIANGDVVGGCLAGRCANSNVHWQRDDLNALCLLIGHDQETWDLCLNLTPAQALTVTEALQRCAAGDVGRMAK